MEYTSIVLTIVLAIVTFWWFNKSDEKQSKENTQVLTIFTPKDASSSDERIIVAIVNPHSGSRKAPIVFETQVKQRLLDANFSIHYYLTQSEGHATEIAKSLDLKNLYAVICVSGDGLLCEMLNGLALHPNKEQALKIPIGIIPAGTSNGLAASLHIEKSVKEAVEVVINGKTRPLDALTVKTPQKTMLGFLCVSHGGVADYDYLTEIKLRWMGPVLKLALAPIQVLSLHKTYKAKISLLQVDPVYPIGKQRPFDCGSECSCRTWSGPEQTTTNERWIHFEEGILNFVASNVPKIAFDVIASKHAHFCDGLLDVRMLRTKVSSRWRFLQLFLNAEKGDYETMEYLDYYKCKTVKMEPMDPKNPGHISVDGHVMDFTGAEISVNRGLLNLLCK